MGILSKAKDFIKSIAGKPATQAITAIQVTNPILALPTIATALTQKPSTTTKVIQSTYSAGAIGGGIAATALTKSVGVGAATSTLLAAPSALSYLETQPKTSKITKVVEEKVGKSAKELVETAIKNPVETLTGAAILPAIAFLAGKAAQPTNTLINTLKTNENIDVTKSSINNITNPIYQDKKQEDKKIEDDLVKEKKPDKLKDEKIMDTTKPATTPTPTTEIKDKPIASELPITPETKTITAGTTKTTKKRRTKPPQSPNIISQKVNVWVNNQNKRYINERVLIKT